MITVRTATADETRAVGAALAMVLRPGDVVLLVGDLGAGKTTFAQGVAAGLGVAQSVTSPTFVLVHPYDCAAPGTAANPTQLRCLLHADLYRVEHSSEVTDLALGELVEHEGAVLVEWGDVAESLLAAAMTVTLAEAATQSAGSAVDADGGGDRVVTIEIPSDRGDAALALSARLGGLRVGD